jgi:formate-dependent nitrite reductase membrane component NrfD
MEPPFFRRTPCLILKFASAWISLLSRAAQKRTTSRRKGENPSLHLHHRPDTISISVGYAAAFLSQCGNAGSAQKKQCAAGTSGNYCPKLLWPGILALGVIVFGVPGVEARQSFFGVLLGATFRSVAVMVIRSIMFTNPLVELRRR